MRSKWHRILAAGTAFSFVLASATMTAFAEGESGTGAKQNVTEVTIYHTNDTHGYLEGDGESVIGLPLVAGLKNTDENAILVDAGDATQGLPLASLTKGNDVIELMNLADYDLMVPGNHEFDFGTEAFLENVDLAEFPVISANIYRDGSLLLAGTQEGNEGCHTVIERDGVKIGFFGLTTVHTASATNPEGLDGVEFTDEIEAAKAEITHLEEAGADVVIAVTHMGDETGGAPCTSADLAEAMTGEYAGRLDAIIDGHSHTVENDEVNDVLIVQTGTGLSAVGKLTVSVQPGQDPSLQEELLGVDAFQNIMPDPEVEQKLTEIGAEQEEMLNEEIGALSTTLWAGTIGQVPPLDRNDSETKIILAGNNYILSGGSDYDMLAGLPKYAEAGGELETIRSYIEKNLENGILTGYAGTEGRISYSGSVYQPKDYTVSVLQIVDEAGNPYADREISYRVDGGEGIMGKTDSDGYLKITLSDGGHGIRVSDAQAEVYVDNYAGIGLVTDAIRPVLKLTAPAPGSEIPVKEQGTPEPEPVYPAEDEEAPGDETVIPGTGDSSMPQIYAAMALAAVAVLVLRYKKENK